MRSCLVLGDVAAEREAPEPLQDDSASRVPASRLLLHVDPLAAQVGQRPRRPWQVAACRVSPARTGHRSSCGDACRPRCQGQGGAAGRRQRSASAVRGPAGARRPQAIARPLFSQTHRVTQRRCCTMSVFLAPAGPSSRARGHCRGVSGAVDSPSCATVGQISSSNFIDPSFAPATNTMSAPTYAASGVGSSHGGSALSSAPFCASANAIPRARSPVPRLPSRSGPGASRVRARAR
jgi:hypothetical protein